MAYEPLYHGSKAFGFKDSFEKEITAEEVHESNERPPTCFFFTPPMGRKLHASNFAGGSYHGSDPLSVGSAARFSPSCRNPPGFCIPYQALTRGRCTESLPINGRNSMYNRDCWTADNVQLLPRSDTTSAMSNSSPLTNNPLTSNGCGTVAISNLYKWATFNDKFVDVERPVLPSPAAAFEEVPSSCVERQRIESQQMREFCYNNYSKDSLAQFGALKLDFDRLMCQKKR
eukprot:Filipodium_phascolosomae@DN2463_c0_g2_i1.p2